MSIGAINGATFTAKKDKKKVDYEKTNVFKITGAALGALGGTGLLINSIKDGDLKNVTKTKAGLIGTAFIAGGTAILALAGSLGDFVINKIVKNTVMSLKKPKD